jgi:hypothetical protein
MKVYYLIWTYHGNSSNVPLPVTAESPEAAVKQLTECFSPDFSEQGRIFVFEDPPKHTFKGSRLRP